MKKFASFLLFVCLSIVALPAFASGGGHWSSWARRPWNPRDATPILYLDANAGVTISTGVSAWADQSFQANNVAQATGSLQPARTTNAANNLPAITFDGVDDMFTAITFKNSKTTGAGGTYFFVVKATSLSASGTHDFLFVSAAADGINPGVQATNSNTSLIAGGGLNAGATLSTSAYQVWTWQHTTGSTSIVRRNSSQLATGSDGASAVGGNGITLGSLAGGTRSIAASVLEVIVYDSVMSATDMGRVEKYLCNRFALGC